MRAPILHPHNVKKINNLKIVYFDLYHRFHWTFRISPDIVTNSEVLYNGGSNKFILIRVGEWVQKLPFWRYIICAQALGVTHNVSHRVVICYLLYLLCISVVFKQINVYSKDDTSGSFQINHYSFDRWH